MKNIKDKISQFRPILNSLLESKSEVPIAKILEIKELITEAESVLETELSHDLQMEVLTLRLSLNAIRIEHFHHQDLQEKLKKYLPILDKACYQKEAMKKFAEKIDYIEDFIAKIYFSIEKLDRSEKSQCEMDILLLEIYVDYLKNKFAPLLRKEQPEEKESKSSKPNLAVKNFLESLKRNSEQDNKEVNEDLNVYLKQICAYLHAKPELFSSLEIDQSVYISKEMTNLKFTVQIKNTSNGFELYVGLKTKLEDWVRSGSYKKVKKNMMLINGHWRKGVDAVTLGEKDSKDPRDKINLALAEAKLVEDLDSLYVHKITPATAYTHKGQYKHSFVSELADGDLDDVIYDPKLLHAMSIGEIFLLCYSMASALAYIHSPKVNLVHRDVKGDNFLIFVDPDGVVWVKLVDFGLTGYSLDDSAKSVDVRSMIITWYYLLNSSGHYQNFRAQKNEVYTNLLLFCKSILKTYEENPPTDKMVMSGLYLILEKMQVTHPQEAVWVKEKIEEHYGTKLNVPSIKGTEMDCLQRFFTQPSKKLSDDINPREVYSASCS